MRAGAIRVYTEFILILDFMSLYPSIASGNNFSFETVLKDRFAATRATELGYEVAYDIGRGTAPTSFKMCPAFCPM